MCSLMLVRFLLLVSVVLSYGFVIHGFRLLAVVLSLQIQVLPTWVFLTNISLWKIDLYEGLGRKPYPRTMREHLYHGTMNTAMR
jgi:hypothetical protein